MFRRIATTVLPVAAAIGMLLSSAAPTFAQVEIDNSKTPRVIWEVVPDPDDQARVILPGAAPNGSKWQGGYLLQTRDGKPATFRRQLGEGKYRIEYDARTTSLQFVSSCREGQAERVMLDPRDKDADLWFIECDEPNLVVLHTDQIWYYPPGTRRMVP